jgi:hypothetical protein
MGVLPVGVPRGFSFRKHFMCDVCGEYFPETDMLVFRGTRYGKPCGCYLDVKSILRNENLQDPAVEQPDEFGVELG